MNRSARFRGILVAIGCALATGGAAPAAPVPLTLLPATDPIQVYCRVFHDPVPSAASARADYSTRTTSPRAPMR